MDTTLKPFRFAEPSAKYSLEKKSFCAKLAHYVQAVCHHAKQKSSTRN